MAFTDWLKKNVTDARDTINTEITKFKSKDLLEAVVAGCALVAYADNTVSPEEKQKMMGYLKTSDQLKVFDQNDVIKIFQKYIEKFEFDVAIGTGEVMQAVGKFRDKPQGQLIVRVCCAIAAADGTFDDKEQAVVRRMCSELGLNPADFSL
ncbi:tellurite resistance TerB family protein [Rhodospirillum rubrum]|uniref:Tellurite resistance TerB n=1 Tax=Rhodospirillum rubrum (strain ATCC 11170 / ATH 1.1.1 / DSM 467 / LMG 4362 / NCIMB 8255 / S1) TaxID=269796 RepID=Q2RW03_RHORT|nr:tellurite resistance TerB family protein [Rhodospirillum rubrum]ABC21692.1 Tellurite resistance TerB [Rhodospirillum rubrum ATCC 11170]AEO47390.1 tellurite resistance TerB [Rhodospirillum rubrum F11]MBK5953244.1 Tellurite resistance TerB [Rhodospirillum rubrum]QXG81354.1 tellurite resistance TerB family protein [Rhodospirillum rubrum]HAQ01376.1 Tellurite resistance TerB [Rhodospirillum rubrum]